jgi:hypothetical protein
MRVRRAEGLALPELGMIGVCRYLVEDEVAHSLEELDHGDVRVPDGIRIPGFANGVAHRIPPSTEVGPEEQGPSVDNDGSGARGAIAGRPA